jgi:LmbE family N-acetylglucosaminyl deacetylase
MNNELRLLMVLAHPDDESLGNGGTLAKYAAEGVRTFLVTATRGERGWFFDAASNPGPEGLGQIREAELRAAAAVLGIEEVSFLDYHDGEFDRADHDEVVGKIVSHIRRIRPHVVVTFDQAGLYGHPDHIAVSRFTTSAVAAAADAGFADPEARDPHGVAKLYYMAWTADEIELYEKAFGAISMDVNGEQRRPFSWPEWATTTRIDALAHWRTTWDAVACHTTQLPNYGTLLDLDENTHARLWGTNRYVRVLSRVPVRSRVEDDLFEGLRDGGDADAGDREVANEDPKPDSWIISEIRRIAHPVAG